MKTSIPINKLPVISPPELMALQFQFHCEIHGYLMQGHDPILFHLADMLLVNAELLTRIIRANEKPAR